MIMRNSNCIVAVAIILAGTAVGCHRNNERPRSFTALHDAVHNGDMAKVEYWLSKGEDVHAIDKHGRTPLCMAAESRRKDIAQLLIDHGADPNDGSLAYAVATEEIDIVQFLLSKGARPGGDPLVQALEDEDYDLAKLLIEKGADVNPKGVDVTSGEPGIEPYGTCGDTPLGIVTRTGNAAQAKLLIENKADVNLRCKYSYPLCEAAQRGYTAIVELLLANGAKTDSQKSGKTAAELAEENGHKNIAELILKNSRK